MSALALLGGRPVLDRELDESAWPLVEDADVDAVVATLRSGRLSWLDDTEVPALEREWASYVGTSQCMALNSGTAALHAAVAAAGVGPGDEVLVPALSFLASATSVLHHQAIPVFVDVDPETFNIDPDDMEARITPRTRAVVVVHLHGLPADLDRITEVARRHDLVVIEDAAQAHGAEIDGRRVGSLGDIGAFSIMAGKNLPTAGEGGLLTTDRPELRDRAEMLKMFGERATTSGPREYHALTLGWNYRLSSVLAAFTRSQLSRLDRHIATVRENAAHLSTILADVPGLSPPVEPAGHRHVYHHYRLRLDPDEAGVDLPVGTFRRAIQDAVTAEGVPLIEYQNRPLPGQVLFQAREGYGRGCPWTCGHTDRDVTYEPEDYPRTLDVIRSSLLVGRRLCMASLLRRENAERVGAAFTKVFSHLDEVRDHALTLDYQDPWLEETRLW